MRTTPDVTSEPLAVASARRVSQSLPAEPMLSFEAMGVQSGVEVNVWKFRGQKYQTRQLI